MHRPSGGQRRLLLGLIVVLALVDIGLLVYRHPRSVGTGTDWTEIEPTDRRVSGIFATLAASGLSAALDSLRLLADRDSVVLRAGHQLAHALGRQALVTSGADAAVIRECGSLFSSGCYHGMVEAYLDVEGRIDVPRLEAMCRAAGDSTRPGPIYECMHGLGHGMLGAVGMNMMEALRLCDQLDGPLYKVSCHEGAFMEAVSFALGSQHRHEMSSASTSARPAGHGHSVISDHLSMDPSDPYSPCRSVPAPYARSCWLFQGFIILKSVGFDAGKALSICNPAPDGWARRCAESVGHQLAGLFQRDDGWIRARCEEAPAELRSSCLAGAMYALVANDWSGTRGLQFCTAAAQRGDTDCFRVLLDLLDQVAPGRVLSEVCAKASKHDKHACARHSEVR